jgi:hypothetical protein
MNKQNRQIKIMGILFAVVLFFFAIAGDLKLLRFYITDETDYNEWTANGGTWLETDYISNFLGKIQFVNMNGLVRNVLQQQEMNGVVKLNNGYLMREMDNADESVLEANALATKELEEYIASWGGNLLYVTVPYVVNKYDPQLPAGVSDYGNSNLDRMREKVEALGINSLDLREEIYEAGISQYDLWYKTDHHWSTEGGFYAYTIMANYIEEMGWADLDDSIGDMDNYDIITYDKWHLGSNGQRTGIYFAGIDDFDLILPKFETTIENLDTGEVGTLKDICLSMDALSNRDYTSRYTYDSVMGNSAGNYYNENAQSDKKILVIGDSMSSAVCPYFILSFQEMRAAGNRKSPVLTREFLDEYQPDIVIMMYYADRSVTEGSFDFELE